MIVHLIDGTYELFRHFYGLRRFNKGVDRPYGAVVGVLQTVLQMIDPVKGSASRGPVPAGDSASRGETGTYLGVATDHVIESFRNRLWPDYKTGAGMEPALLAQFHPLEEALLAMGVAVWPMVEFEADDALASAAHLAAQDPRVERVIICTPDKDLAQCVRGTRVVRLECRARRVLDETGVIGKFGVPPASIPDYLALVGDSADGYPGLPGWGPKSTAAVLSRFGDLDRIPADWREWHANASNAPRLAAVLSQERDRARLFRRLAT